MTVCMNDGMLSVSLFWESLCPFVLLAFVNMNFCFSCLNKAVHKCYSVAHVVVCGQLVELENYYSGFLFLFVSFCAQAQLEHAEESPYWHILRRPRGGLYSCIISLPLCPLVLVNH